MERVRVGFLLGAALALAGCGGAAMTDGPSPAASTGTGPPASGMTLTRTGGIAGFNDVLEIETSSITLPGMTAIGIQP